MSEQTDTITLTPEEEATRLWNGALAAFERARDDFVALCEALDLGVRAVEVMAVQRLRTVAGRFPATIATQLEVPDPKVDVQRDAVTVPTHMEFIGVLDLLSEEDAKCVSPRLHRGWEDRRFSCRRSRSTAREAAGTTVPEASRQKLLLLAAYRNRIFRVPPPVKVKTSEVLAAFPALVELYASLTAGE